MRCYIFDIDGTIADLSHRLPHIQKTPKDWTAFFASVADDVPIEHTIKLAIDAEHEQKGALRHHAARIIRFRRAVGEFLPWSTNTARLICAAECIVPKCFFGRGISFSLEPLSRDLFP